MSPKLAPIKASGAALPITEPSQCEPTATDASPTPFPTVSITAPTTPPTTTVNGLHRSHNRAPSLTHGFPGDSNTEFCHGSSDWKHSTSTR